MTTRKRSHEPVEGDPPEPATAPLEARVAELESALAEARDRHLRLAADFDNYKKRARQEQLETIQHASADLIARLLAPKTSNLSNSWWPSSATTTRCWGLAGRHPPTS